MRTNEDRNWELIGNALAAEAQGRAPRLFSSRRTLFGIPSALDEELAKLDTQAAAEAQAARGASAPDAEGAGERPPADHGPATASEPAVAKAPRPSAPRPARGPQRVEHNLDPVFDERSRVLILGTMPSPRSRETGFYYNHPQNRFWKVMAALFDEPLPATNEEKRDLALRHGIALWDVLASCVIEGASDGTIAECVPNDIAWLTGRAPIEAVFCTGAKAHELYRRHCEAAVGMAATRLPSTSPANAAASLEHLIDAYRAILPHARP